MAGRNQSEKLTKATRKQSGIKKHHSPKRDSENGKKQQQTKTTKHTIEFSNNTPGFQATLPLYSTWSETSNLVRQSIWTGAVGFSLKTTPCRAQPQMEPSGLCDSLDLRAQAAQILDEQRVAAIDVEHIVDLGVTVGDQAGQDQPGAGADVRGPHRRAGQLRDSPHHRMVAVRAGVGAQPDHFLHE